jgi:beta-glucanase (GH16 family)
MRAIILLTALLYPPLAAAEEAKTLPPRDASWHLVWADEFDRDGPPDPKRWEFEQGFLRNRELQWYQPENAICRNGLLVIEARRERIQNPSYEENHHSWKNSRPHASYTSSSIITREQLAWKYGRFEIRARGQGRARPVAQLQTSGR